MPNIKADEDPFFWNISGTCRACNMCWKRDQYNPKLIGCGYIQPVCELLNRKLDDGKTPTDCPYKDVRDAKTRTI